MILLIFLTCRAIEKVFLTAKHAKVCGRVEREG